MTMIDQPTNVDVRRVLVADDEPDVRYLVEFSLELAGFEVLVAGDGEEALRIAREESPDLVLLDWMMPKLDGLDVLSALRRDELTAGIPVVLLTARSSDQDTWDGWRAGADYFLTKPFDTSELTRYVDYLIAQRRERVEAEAADAADVLVI